MPGLDPGIHAHEAATSAVVPGRRNGVDRRVKPGDDGAGDRGRPAKQHHHGFRHLVPAFAGMSGEVSDACIAAHSSWFQTEIESMNA
jgi:hypothetical protein